MSVAIVYCHVQCALCYVIAVIVPDDHSKIRNLIHCKWIGLCVDNLKMLVDSDQGILERNKSPWNVL